MKRTGLFIAAMMLCRVPAPAENKDMIELQRDVAQLQDQVRELQRSFDERFAALQVLVQQTLDASNKSNNALDSAGQAQQGLAERLGAPIAGLNSKVDGMGNDVSGMRESVNDLTARMGKIERQLTDLNNVIKALQAPAAAPPASPGMPVSGAGVPGPGDASAAGVPPVKATTLYENALKDKQSGKADLALGEFQDYIRFYHDTDAAAAAQYYIGEIHYSQEQYDAAIQDFDKVLEAYPNNNKTADAHYMKGKTLAKIGQRKAAAKEFLAVVTDFPHSDVAPQSRALLNRARVTAAQ